MSKPAISIHNLSKEYLITKGKKKEVFKALDTINLEIEEGKVTGLIGPNGAGKSTLLKILSRITYPTKGEVKINGRLASLLEVGTGFHPELSGRENIFLNGAVLGMSRSEIQKQFDEIVDFSGVEEFLDTAVKHYSSGMYVRLAFSVAAHLQSEILLVDEVLAVGDAEFQKKCISKMSEATRDQNRTVIFVSHNLSVARSLCDSAIFLKNGKIEKQGPVKEVTDYYLDTMLETTANKSLGDRADREGTGEVRIQNIEVLHPKTGKQDLLVCSESAEFTVTVKSKRPTVISDLDFELNIFNDKPNYVTTLSNKFVGAQFKQSGDLNTFKCTIDKLPLMAGNYYLRVKLSVNGVAADVIDRALYFEVLLGDFYNSGNFKQRSIPGVYIDQQWTEIS
mgnify:CR=1 FL=1